MTLTFAEPGEPTVMPHPTVTFVIPCYNHGRFVAKAAESALAQVDASVRVVIVNDGSTDGSTPAECDRCAGDRVMVIHQENRGLPAARNHGAAHAHGDFLVFLDADDWVAPRFVTKLRAALQGEEALGAAADVSHVYCQERLVEHGRGVWRVPAWDPVLMLITNLHPVTTLVRRECFEAVGGFDESMRDGYEDWDLWLKFVERGWRGVRVQEPLFVWRRHSAMTMVMRAVQNHRALYERIVAQHPKLYERHRDEMLIRMNTMMRQFDMNWLDESGEPINLMALKRQRAMYEGMAAVRLHHWLHRGVNALPGPLARLGRGMLGLVRRVVPAAPKRLALAPVARSHDPQAEMPEKSRSEPTLVPQKPAHTLGTAQPTERAAAKALATQPVMMIDAEPRG
jgi:glycosyltransferase involved in cell wall biosynthesis